MVLTPVPEFPTDDSADKNSSDNATKDSVSPSSPSLGIQIRPRPGPGTAQGSGSSPGNVVQSAAGRDTRARTQEQSPVSPLLQPQSHFHTAHAYLSRPHSRNDPTQRHNVSNYLMPSPGHSAAPQNTMLDPNCLPLDSFQNLMMQTSQVPSTPVSPTSHDVHALVA